MKKCPQCKSTYGDDTLSFCLQDGSPLSAAYDSETTLVLGADESTVQRTNANYAPEISTETQFGETRRTESSIHGLSPNKTSPHLIYAGAGLIAVFVIVGGLIWISGRSQETSQNANRSTLAPHQIPNTNTVSNKSVSSATSPAISSWEGKVSAADPTGVQTISPEGRTFMVSTGDEIEIKATGIVQVGSDRSPTDADGEKGYRDTSVDSPYSDRVGGLEMWIDNKDNRYFVGRYFRKRINHSGVITFRVVESLRGYKGTGAFQVEITKNPQSSTRTGTVPTTRELQDTLLKEAQRIEDEAKRR